MQSPEVHVHVHIHNGNADVATFNVPVKTPRPVEAPQDQLSFDAPYIEEVATETTTPTLVSPGTSKGGPTSAVITPQDPEEQRKQIALTSQRNRHLMELDRAFSDYRSRDAYVEGLENGRIRQSRAKLPGAKRNRDTLRETAMTELSLACGNCALAETCGIKDNFGGWGRIHIDAKTKGNSTSHSQADKEEPRDKWRRRLLDDPNASCLPPKTTTKKAAPAKQQIT